MSTLKKKHRPQQCEREKTLNSTDSVEGAVQRQSLKEANAQNLRPSPKHYTVLELKIV